MLILFGGSGSEIAVCHRLGLNWISAESIPEYCGIIEKRLANDGMVAESDRMINFMKRKAGHKK